MARWIFRTDNDVTAVFLRAALGIMMLAHGLQKLGLVGGGSLEASLGFFTEFVGVPRVVGWFVILFEVVGGAALIAGLAGRVAAAGTAVIMVVAVLKVHLSVGFFMNWFGTLQGEGYEFHILALAMAAALTIRGSGAWSVDRLLSMRAQRVHDPSAKLETANRHEWSAR